jgi:hypothetical protein
VPRLDRRDERGSSPIAPLHRSWIFQAIINIIRAVAIWLAITAVGRELQYAIDLSAYYAGYDGFWGFVRSTPSLAVGVACLCASQQLSYPLDRPFSRSVTLGWCAFGLAGILWDLPISTTSKIPHAIVLLVPFVLLFVGTLLLPIGDRPESPLDDILVTVSVLAIILVSDFSLLADSWPLSPTVPRAGLPVAAALILTIRTQRPNRLTSWLVCLGLICISIGNYSIMPYVSYLPDLGWVLILAASLRRIVPTASRDPHYTSAIMRLVPSGVVIIALLALVMASFASNRFVANLGSYGVLLSILTAILLVLLETGRRFASFTGKRRNPPDLAGSQSPTQLSTATQGEGDSANASADRVDRFMAWARRNPIVSSVIIISIVVTALGTSFQNLWGTPLLPALRKMVAHARPSPSVPIADEWKGVKRRPISLLAFATRDGIYVAPKGQNKQVVQKLNVESNERVKELFWSPQGRYLGATVVHGDEFTEANVDSVWYRDTVTGDQGVWRCICAGSAFVGGALVALGSDLSSLHVFQPNRSPEVIHFSWKLWRKPAWSEVLAGSADGLVVAIPDPKGTSAYGGPEWVYVLGLDGSSRWLYEVHSNAALASPILRPGGSQIAAITEAHGGLCNNRGFVLVINAANGAGRSIMPPTNGVWEIWSLAWGYDRKLYSVMHSIKSGQSPEACLTLVSPTLYQLDGDAWRPIVTPFRVGAADCGPSGAFAVLRLPRDYDKGAQPNALYLWRPGRTPVAVARGVSLFSWSPPLS